MPLNPKQQAQFDAVCDILAEGKSLRIACRAKGTPVKSTFLRWKNEDETGALSDQYARARANGADACFDKALDMSNKAGSSDVGWDRVKLDAIKWATSKMAPKKYGDKLDLDVKADVNTSVELVISPHELIQERLAQIAKRSGNDS